MLMFRPYRVIRLSLKALERFWELCPALENSCCQWQMLWSFFLFSLFLETPHWQETLCLVPVTFPKVVAWGVIRPHARKRAAEATHIIVRSGNRGTASGISDGIVWTCTTTQSGDKRIVHGTGIGDTSSAGRYHTRIACGAWSLIRPSILSMSVLQQLKELSHRTRTSARTPATISTAASPKANTGETAVHTRPIVALETNLAAPLTVPSAP